MISRTSAILVACSLCLAQAGFAGSVPTKGALQFDVMRKGTDIGDHSYRFEGSGGAVSVRVSTDIAVKVPVIRTTAYRFQHSSVEQWSGDSLRRVKSKTDDDGTPHSLDTSGSGVLPASLWNADIVRQSRLLNTVNGRIMAIHVADLGTEAVATQKGKVAAHHYRLSGDLARDLWYDAEGNLAHVSFTADDGSTVTYLRK